jgi:non-specific serine/threonine protein kinase
LKVPGELTWRVPPLTRDEALRLFTDRARSHDPPFRLSDDNVDIVGRICERLDFIPLAIELAAARVTLMPVEEILEHLESRFALLTGGSRTAATRLRTLRAAMDWSYELLPDVEKVLFRRLSVFAGRFSLDAVEEVCPEDRLSRSTVLGPLAELVDKSLVMAAGGRYRLLETVRTYGRERLTDAHEIDIMQARLGAYVLGLAESRAAGQLGPWLDRLEAIHDDIRNSLKWSISSDPERGIRLAVALAMFWQLRAHASEPRQFMKELLEHAPRDFPLHAAGLYLAGYFAYLQLDFPAARRLLESALEEARAGGDRLVVLRALEVTGLVATAAGELVASQAALNEALELARDLGEQQLEAGILQQLGILASVRRDLPQARAFLEQSIALRAALGRNDEASMSLTFLAAVALMQGDAPTTRRSVAESLGLGRTLSDRRAAFTMDVLACLTAVEGGAERALLLAGAASALHEASGNTPPAIWDEFMSPYLKPARQTLGAEAARSTWDDGRRMDFEDALQLALHVVSAATST